MNIFTYGSLMFPEVIEALTKQNFLFEDITLANFERCGIIGKQYPGLYEKVGSSVDVRLWFDIDKESLQMLNRFEDSIYERRVINAKCVYRGSVDAIIYVIPPNNEYMLTYEPWDINYFKNKHLAEYVSMCQRFRANELAKKQSM